jgi:acylphosphatase
MDENLQLRTTVEGFVQGVGFRYFVLKIAVSLDLTGWVRNTYDGNVEVLAEGRRDILEQLLIALRRGPSRSQVENVRFDFQPATGLFESFQVRSGD